MGGQNTDAHIDSVLFTHRGIGVFYITVLITRRYQVQKRQRTTRRYKVPNLARTSEWNPNFLLPSIIYFLVVACIDTRLSAVS